jgi:hypothetical protein
MLRGRRIAAAAGSVLALAVAVAGLSTIVYTAGGLGAVAGSERPDPALTARAFVAAWAGGDYRRMYRLLTPTSRNQISYRAFRRDYLRAARLASLRHLRQLRPVRAFSATATVPLAARTLLFGTLRARFSFALRVAGKRYGVVWQPRMTFPSLLAGERLVRRSRVPRSRGSILASDGSVLAEGPPDARSYPEGGAFSIVTGFLKSASGAALRRRTAAGWPATTPYGQGGLERSLDAILAGRPALRLVAEGGPHPRVLARRPGRSPRNVRTTLSVRAQIVAADALGGRYGGVVVLDARSGALLASAGFGMDILQPPGSTFKMVTASAALASGAATE